MKPSRGARVSTRPRNGTSRRPPAAANNDGSNAEKQASAALANKASATSSRAQRGSSRAVTSTRAGSRSTAAARPRADRNETSQSSQQAPVSITGGSPFDFKLTASTRYKKLKLEQEKERADAIRNGRMHDPNKPRTLAEAITPVGTCPDMCPEFERVERIVQNDVWGPEGDRNIKSNPQQSWKIPPDETRMVKKFRRAAAGIDEQLPSELRPPAVLQRTTDFLFNEVIGQAEYLSQVHHFVWDRTRAIRNDFSIQQLTKIHDVQIAMSCYERIARFHILSLHQFALAEKPYEQYDDKQEREQLDKTLLSLIQYYDDNRNRCQSPNEEEFRAYYIIFQISGHAPDMQNRVQHWPRKMLQNSYVALALSLYTAASNPFDDQGPLRPFDTQRIASANWARWWELLDNVDVPYLLACVAEIQFSIVRRNALWTIWQAYKPLARTKIEDWTLMEMQEPLRYEHDDEVEEFVNKFGIEVSEKEDGQGYVDLASRQDKELPPLTITLRKQQKSSFVEEKREGRTFPAVINGMSVEQAQAAGLIESTHESSQTNPSQEVEMSDDDYLFVQPGPKEPTPKQQKVRFNIPPTLNPSAPKWQPSSSTLFTTSKESQLEEANQESTQNSQNSGSTSLTPAAAPSSNTSSQPSLFTPNATTGSQLFAPATPSTGVPTSDSEQSSIFKRPFLPAKFPPQASSSDNVQSTTTESSTGSFLFPTQQDTKATSPTPVAYPTLPSFDGTPSSQPAFQPTTQPTTQSNQNPQSPSFTFPSKPTTSPATTPQSTSNVPSASTSKGHKPQSSSPLSRPPLNQEDAGSQSAQQPGTASSGSTIFQSFNNSSTAYSSHPLALTSFSPWLFPRKEEPQPQSQPPSQSQFQPPPQPQSQQQAPLQFQQQSAKAMTAPTADLQQQPLFNPIQSQKPDAKAKKEAQEQAEIEERRTRTLDRVAQVAFLEPNGLLAQYIEYIATKRIIGAQRRLFTAKVNKEADDYRRAFLETKYFRKWRSWWWERKIKRQGTARRQRMKAAKEARIAEDFRRSQREQEKSLFESFRQSQNTRPPQHNAEESITEARQTNTTTKQDVQQSELQQSQQSPKDEADARPQLQDSSAMPPPPRPGQSPDRPRVYNALGLSNPMNPPAHRRSQSAWAQPYIASRPDPTRPMRSSSLKNPFSPFTSMQNEGPVDSRIDKTQSVYFKLKARGVDQIDRFVKDSAAAAAQRKRPRTSDSAEAVDAPPRKVNSTDISNSQTNGGNSTAASPPVASELSPSQLKDEELFAAARKVREEMRESQSFFRKEVDRDSLARSQSSRAGSPPDDVSVASASSKYRAQLESIMRDGPLDDYRPPSRQSNTSQRSISSVNAPPAYRNRVSKFVPREMYAHVRSRQSSVSGASPRRLSGGSTRYNFDSVTGSNARIAERAERYLAEEKDRILRQSTNSEGVANGAWLSPPLAPQQPSDIRKPVNVAAMDDASSSQTHTEGKEFTTTLLSHSTGSVEHKSTNLERSPTSIKATANNRPAQKAVPPSNQNLLRSNPFAALEMDEDEDEAEEESEAESSVRNGYGNSNGDLGSMGSDDGVGSLDEEEEGAANVSNHGMSATQARDKFGGKTGASVEDAIEL